MPSEGTEAEWRKGWRAEPEPEPPREEAPLTPSEELRQAVNSSAVGERCP